MSEKFEMYFGLSVGLLFWAVIIYLIVMAFQGVKYKKDLREKQKEELRKQGIFHKMSCIHFSGLPISSGVLCDITLCTDKVIFKRAGNTFNLEKNKITDVCIKTDVEIQTQYVSDAGGAVAGAMSWGAIGAIIGGGTREIKNQETSYYLIYTYLKNNTVDYISFDVTNDPAGAKPLVDDFSTSSHAHTTINL